MEKSGIFSDRCLEVALLIKFAKSVTHNDLVLQIIILEIGIFIFIMLPDLNNNNATNYLLVLEIF